MVLVNLVFTPSKTILSDENKVFFSQGMDKNTLALNLRLTSVLSKVNIEYYILNIGRYVIVK